MKRFAFPIVLISLVLAACGTDDGPKDPEPTDCVQAIDCDDGDPCTVDGCINEGECTHEQAPLGTSCETGDLCVVSPACTAAGECVGAPRDCTAEEIPCMDNICDPQTGQCGVSLPNGSACDFNENDCTAGDVCMAGLCVLGTETELDDLNPCTQDACVKGEVVHEPILEGQCDDDNECTTNDSCHLGTCVGGDPVECVIPECGASAECVQDQGCVVDFKPGGAECDDNDQCTLFSVCDSQSQCVGGGNIECNDGNDCTDDYCAAESGCWYQDATGLCDDGDTCTVDDACSQGTCAGTASTTQGFTVDCSDTNALDDDGCCCWATDPLGTYNSGHVLDLGQEFNNISMEICLKPGGFASCSDTAHIGLAGEDLNWLSLTNFETTTQPTEPGGTIWQTYCYDLEVPETFRYVHIANDLCWLDFVSVTLGCDIDPGACAGSIQDCDDDNTCTADSCDGETGACVYEAIEADWCLELDEGNNLISFSHLPDHATLPTVLGNANPYVKHLFTEGKMSKNIESVGWVGNIAQLERTRSYWIYMDFPTGTTSMVVQLPGDITDADIKYQIHQGRNMMSFAGDPTAVTEALPDDVEDLFTMCIGQGIATIPNPNGEGWVGSLTTFRRNKGYENLVDAAIPDFSYNSGGDGVDPYTYGCTHPAGTNYDLNNEIDDGSCAFDLPESWGTPVWNSSTHHQGFLVFYDLTLAGAPLAQHDVVAAIVEGQVVGVGFPEGNRVTVPAMGDHTGKTVTYELYDQSEGTASSVAIDGTVDWTNNGFLIAGCTDASKANFVPFANLSIDVCTE